MPIYLNYLLFFCERIGWAESQWIGRYDIRPVVAMRHVVKKTLSFGNRNKEITVMLFLRACCENRLFIYQPDERAECVILVRPDFALCQCARFFQKKLLRRSELLIFVYDGENVD